MDSVGAIAGPLLAAPLIVAVGYRWLFAISVIPGVLAAVAVVVLVRDCPSTPDRPDRPAPTSRHAPQSATGRHRRGPVVLRTVAAGGALSAPAPPRGLAKDG